MDDIQYLTVDHLSTKDLIRIFSQVATHDDLWFNDSPCWIWCGSRNERGYGWLSYQNRQERTHRIVYAWTVGPIPRGRNNGELDHLCKRPSCCNPLHLEHVSTQVNILRSASPTAVNSRKTHCVRGHALAPRHSKGKSERYCPTCAHDLARDRRIANPAPSREYRRRYKERNPELVRIQGKTYRDRKRQLKLSALRPE
jgi:hypothetical protein